MNIFRLCLAAAAGLFLVSCAAPGGGRSEYGHRPGPKGFRTVILDAGHGGHDSGAKSRWTGQMEKDAAMDTVRRLRQELGGQFRVVLMRDGDEFIPLDERVRRANGYPDAVLISMHYNHGGANTRGTETFYWRMDSYSLAKRIQQELAAVVPSEQNNGGLVRRRIRLTRNPQIPCVLVEGGYMSHAAESRLIADPGYRQRLARAVAKGIRDQAASGDAGMGPLPRPINAPLSRPTDASEY
ncbi:MAG: N-acetylmuramoyl-L-alanine amidase [Verrucomicrobiota bacterium]